jgi:hypothetical protein
MTTPLDDQTLRRYREASAQFDERPAAGHRAAILAAAARQVDAKPRAAGAPRAVRMRWPLAAAAAVMLSTLAVMLASRTEQDMATFSAPTESAAPLAAPQPAPALEMAPQPAPQSAPAPQSMPRSEPAERRAAPRSTEGQAPAAAAPLREPSSEAAPALKPAPPAAPSAMPAPSAGDVSPSPDRTSEAVAPTRKPQDARRSGPAADTSALTERRSETAGAAAQTADLPAAQWLERIVQLRAAGRHEDADRELERFRERHPQVQLPAAALAPTATR